MKSLEVVSAILTLAITTHTAFAATEFEDSVPLDVVKQLIGNPLGGESRFYSDILDGFPPFTVPAGFTVRASTDQGYLQRVLLSTTLDSAAALDTTGAALADAGWSLMPNASGIQQPQGGFVSATPAPQYQQLCHDEHGILTVSVNDAGGVRYVSLNSSVGPGMDPAASCAQMLDPANQGRFGLRNPAQALMQHMPRLVMPLSTASPQVPNGSFYGGGGGSSSDWESRGTLTIDWSIDRLASHFVTQIEEQGWISDSKATGALVASGSWTKTVNDLDLIGVLTIVQTADDAWDLKFRILQR